MPGLGSRSEAGDPGLQLAAHGGAAAFLVSLCRLSSLISATEKSRGLSHTEKGRGFRADHRDVSKAEKQRLSGRHRAKA